MKIDKGFHQGLRTTCFMCAHRIFTYKDGDYCTKAHQHVELYWHCNSWKM